MKIGWILIGDATVPSSRIAGINVSNKLAQLGHDSRIISMNAEYKFDCAMSKVEFERYISCEKPDAVIFQKVNSPKVLEFMGLCRTMRIGAIYACQDYYEHPVFRMANGIIVSSPYMKEQLNNLGLENVHYVDDALEAEMLV